MRLIHYLLLSLLALVSCRYQPEKEFSAVVADFETEPVSNADDAADDPAIWINPADPNKSLLICSNKQSGISVYNLQGKTIAEYPVGKINNVDVRQGIFLNDSLQVDIVAGSNRTGNTITIMQILHDGSLKDITAGKIQSGFSEVYGFCLYHDLKGKQLYAVVNNKEGMVEQWRLLGTDSLKIDGELARTFKAGESQLEGCVGDDELGYLYIGEEDKGIWKFFAHPDSAANGTLVDDLSNPSLKDDIEGLAIFYGENGKGYLIASSQGNNSFAVYRREGNNDYLGSFSIVDSEIIDGVSETDGIDVTSNPIGPQFPSGFFIVQDGYNYEGAKQANQNFKVVNWKKISASLNLK